MRSPSNALPLRQALALGALQGPAELLPISSSAHTSTIPWLLGWDYGKLDGELRKSFEVALHAGTALALVISQWGEILRPGDRPGVSVTAAACLPPAITGYALEREIERHLGTPWTIAVGLLAGSVAMVLADGFPERRGYGDAGVRDGLWLGLAQSIALIPGISRSGATLSAARLLGFDRRDAEQLSARVGLPVLAGAALLKGIRLARRGLDRESAGVFAIGTAGAFTSTLACAGVARRRRLAPRLAPYALYRIGLAVLLIRSQMSRKLGSNTHDQGHVGSAW